MNKIYKVVWSKAKHCYVVASELAKRNTKGCGARSLRMAAVSMGVAAALICGFGTTAEAKRYEITIDNVDVTNNLESVASIYTFQGPMKTLTVDQTLIDQKTGSNKYFYGNVVGPSGKSITTTAKNGNLVDITDYYSPFTQQVIIESPFNDSGELMKDGAKTTVGALVQASPGASTNVSGYSVTLTGTGLTDAAGALSWGGDVSNNSITVNGGQASTIYGGSTSTGSATNNTVTIGSGSSKAENVYGGYASGYPASGNANSNHVFVNGGTVDYNLWGGYSASGNATGNEVTVTSGTVVSDLYGGKSEDKNANNNIVKITGGAVATATYAGVYGGSANGTANENNVTVGGTANIANVVCGGTSSSEANGNTVTISGGTVNSTGWSGAVIGGMSSGGGADKTENGNTVLINGTANVTGDVAGGLDGYYTATASDNRVSIDGSAVVTGNVMGGSGESRDKTKNKVYINKTYKGSVTGNVYGGRLDDSGNYFTSDDPNSVWYDKGNANSNEVYISGGTVSGSVYGGAVLKNVTGNANSNKVEISGGEVKTARAGSGDSVYGGYSETGNANSNKVQVSGESIVKLTVYGGVTKYTEGTASDNEVTVSGNAKLPSGITAGWSPNKDVKNNTVTIEGGTVQGYINGGVATGAADNNRIIVNGGTVSYLQGGSGGSSATWNTVEINGGTVTDTIFGGNSDAGTVTGNTVTVNKGTVNTIYGGYSNSGTVTNNTVTVSNATLNGAVIGGTNGDGDANGNTVSIAGGTIGGAVWGGYSRNGDAKNNTVTVTDMAAGRAIYGGYAGNLAKSATGNIVKIKNVTAPNNYHNLQGGYTDYTAEPTGDFVTGNTLIINGSNKFGGAISNFETIKLADDFEWKDGATVLQGNFAVNYNKTKPVLDITDAETALSSATSGSMILLASSSANDFSTLSLKYSGGTATLDSANVTKDVKSGEGASSVANGVTITSATIHTVSLDKDNSYKNVLYKVQNGVSGISFAAMDWNAGRAAAAGDNFANVATVDATNLTFNDPEKASGSMALLSGATGIVSDMSVTAANHTQNFTNTLSNNVKLGATLEGTVTTLAGVVNYTVKDTTVKSVDLSNWNGRSSAVASGWKSVDGCLTVTAAGFTDPKLAAGQTYLDIVTTDTEGFFGSVTGDKAYQGSNLNLDAGNGVLVKGLQASGVKAEESGKKLTYYASVKDVNSIEVSGWDGTEATAVDLTGWNLADGIAVDTDGMAAPGAMAAGDSKTLVEATGANFTGIAVTGAYAWQNEGSLDTAPVNGVSVTGSSTGGGVKGDGTKIIYQKSKNAITSLTFGEVDFADKGTARSFGADDDLSSASINADGLSFSNASSLSSGQSMTLVDATGALGTATIANFKDKKYETTFEDKVTDNLTIKGAQTDWLKQNGGTKLVYTVGDRVASEAAMSGDLAWSDGVTHYTNTNYKFDGNTKVNVGVNFTATADPLAGTTKTMTLLKDATGVAASNVTGTPSFTVTLDQANTTLSAGAAGTVGLSGNDVTYAVSSVQLQTVTVKNVGDAADTVPVKWTIADGAVVETDGMAVPDVAAGTHKDILQSNTDHFFANVTVNGANAYKPVDFKEESSGVTLAGSQEKGVTLNSEKNHLIYAVGSKDVTSVTLGNVTWQKDATLVDGSSTDYNYSGVTEITADDFVIMNPEDVAADDSMTLLKANATLQEMAQKMKASYNNYEVAPGVTIDGNITGQMSRSGNNVTFTAAENKASQLTFGDVEWKDSGALLTRPANIVFDGAKVVTTNIKFTNIDSQVADQTMTLVHKFDGTPSAIEGDHYMVGSGRIGEGAAEMNGNDLIFRTKTGTAPTEATHETVMAMEAGTAVVAAGREFVDSAVEGLGLVSNMAPDGTSTFASMGGGVGRYKTGSHVDTHTWSAVVAVGSKREHKKGSLEWGVFAEYGRGNYTLHDDNGGRGDGDTHYAGGGLLAKWTNKHDVYAEASVRLGRMSDSASNMLTDRLGNSYGYDVHANYVGGHVGFGKIYKVQKTKDLDVYGKFFYTRRNGVDFDAGGNHYSLDSVNSSLLRVGARYGSNDRKWNWYGGLAYEYEFGGESKGTVDGLAIRSASIKGASVRGEIGMRMEATKTNPWKVDIGIFGYGGKHRGFGGSVNVAYMF